MNKKMFTLILTIVLTISITNSVTASNLSLPKTGINAEKHNLIEEKKLKEVTSILAEIGMNKAQMAQESFENSNTSPVFLTNTSSLIHESIIELEGELEELGVKKLTQNELNAMLENIEGNVSSFSNIPPSTSTVDWYGYTTTYTKVNGTVYDLEYVFAQGSSPSSNLYTVDNVTLYTNAQRQANATKALVTLAVQEAIGYLPIIGYIPTDLYFPSSTGTYTINNYMVNHVAIQTVWFTYSKPSTANVYKTANISSMVNISAGHSHNGSNRYMIGSIPYNEPFNRTFTKDNTIYAEKWGDHNLFLQGLDGIGTTYAFLKNYKFSNDDGSKSKTYDLLQPLLPSAIR